MARRLGLAAVIALVVLVLALCARPRPEVRLTISGATVPASRGNCSDGGACPPPVAPLAVVRTTTPVRLDFVVGSEVDQIDGAVWRGETMTGTTIETFTLKGGDRSYTTTQLKGGWSRLHHRVRPVVKVPRSGSTSRAFLVEIAPP